MALCSPGNGAVRISATAASGLPLRLGVGWISKEFLATMFAAKIECLSVVVGVDRGGFVNGHPTDGVFGSGYYIVHGDLVFLGYLLFSSRTCAISVQGKVVGSSG